MAPPSTHKSALLRRQWRRWVNRLEGEVHDLVIAQHIYETVGALVDGSDRATEYGDYHFWSVRNYAIKTAVSVRRLMDRKANTVSLGRLVADIAKHEGALTTRSHVALHPPRLRDTAHIGFQRYAGQGASYFPAAEALNDLRLLTVEHEQIRRLVNKRFAHLERRNLKRRVPSIEEMHDVVGLFERVFSKYAFLLLAHGEISLLPTWSYDWTDVFTVPWKTTRG